MKEEVWAGRACQAQDTGNAQIQTREKIFICSANISEYLPVSRRALPQNSVVSSF